MPTPTPPLVTEADLRKTADWLDGRRRWPADAGDGADRLRRTLAAATVVRESEIPADVVTLHARVRVLEFEDALEAAYTLVLAEAAGPGTVSVASPLGAALLGRRSGDEVTFQAGGRATRVRIQSVVYQPEAASRRGTTAAVSR